jgi:hypothetical protein
MEVPMQEHGSTNLADYVLRRLAEYAAEYRGMDPADARAQLYEYVDDARVRELVKRRVAESPEKAREDPYALIAELMSEVATLAERGQLS